MLYNNLVSLINSAKLKTIDTVYSFDYASYLSEFRTINCNLPRQVGKTTTLVRLHKNTSSLLFSRMRTDPRYPTVESWAYECLFRGRNLHGLKYSLILLDEYSVVPDKLFDIILYLRTVDVIAEDLMIVGLHTK